MPATTAANRQLPQAIDVLASPLFFSVSTKGEIAGTGFISARYSANTGGPNYTLQKARGTIAAPADAIAGDTAFNLLAQAYDAGAFRTIANLAGRCAIGFGGGDSPGLWAFQTTPVGSYTQRDVVLFDSAGNVQFVVDGTLNAAAVDAVSLVGVDRINTRHAAAANRVLAFQSERGSPIYLGDDALDFAATTGVVSVNGTDLLSMTSTAATLAGNLFITGTLPYVDVKPSGWASSGYIQFGVSPSFAASGNYGGLYVPAGKGIAFTQAGTTLFLMDVGGNVGLGVGSTAPLAKFESRATSGAQIIASFDASNHFSTTVSSLGAVTFDATGESAGFTFSDAVTATSLACPTFTSAAAMTFEPTAGQKIQFNVPTGKVAIQGNDTYGYMEFLEITGNAARGSIGYGDNGYVFTGALTNSFAIRSENALHLGGSGDNLTMTAVSGNVGIGTTSPSAKLHAISTTEQLRLGYDASNYLSTTVSSAGLATLATTGTNASITLTPSGTGNVIMSKIPRFNGTNSTGAGSSLLGANSPATTLTAPYTWISVITSDGSTGYIPCWK